MALPTLLAADPSLECSINNDTQVEIGTCLTATEAKVDGSVKLALGFAHGSAEDLDNVTEGAGSVKALEQGQSDWNAYRDAHCKFVGTTFGGGSGTGIAIQSCRIELGRLRVTELMKFAQ
ncbi:MAG: DUF1311 domain-containing protein [Rhodobacteraceae bacterium]|nr:DUF1311 domain-containing protein [Paracoccaceae bacterium]